MIRTLLSVILITGISVFSKAFDVYVSPGLLAPNPSSCQLGTAEALNVIFQNGPGAAPGPIQMSYSLNGAPAIVENYPGGIASNASFNYTFTSLLDLSACQVHTILVEIYIPGDTDPSDNSYTFNVTSDCAPTTGTITAPTEVCQNLNSGSMNLTGYTGTIESWIYSTDGGLGWSWAGNAATQPYTNINGPMEWAVIINSPFGVCEDDTTAWSHIDIVPQTITGNLPADFDICDNGNGGSLNLTGYLGTILGWEFSEDGGATWTPLANTTDVQNYWNLDNTTLYQVQVQNDICPAVYSAPVTLTLTPGSDAGTIVGEAVVCNFENDSSLQANPVNGNVIGWNVSTDGGSTWFTTTVTGPVYPYANLDSTTLFASIVQSGSCPNDTTYHLLVVLPLGASAGPDVTIIEGDSTALTATGGSYFNWSPNVNISNPNIYNPVVWPHATTAYAVVVTDVNGCSDTAYVTITVNPDLMTLNIPNMLTPNGDGYNDLLVIENIESYPKNEILIFNSYGQVIFRSSPYNNDWTATFENKGIPDGTYFYVLNLNDDSSVQDEYKGVITVMGR